MTGTNLTPADLEMFAGFRITPSVAAKVALRVTDLEARSLYQFNGSGNNAGLILKNLAPLDSQARTYVLRRDHPPIVDGKPDAKYLHSGGNRSYLFFPPDCGELLSDPSCPVVFVESEKACLALWCWAGRVSRPLLPIACSGVWGWRGRIGKVLTPDGHTADEKGPLPDFDLLNWKDRTAVILFDSNAGSNSMVRAGRRALAEELAGRGAVVRLADIPAIVNVNGPDDLVRECSDTVLGEILDSAKPVPAVAESEALAAIAEIETQVTPVDSEQLKQLKSALAAVEDHEQRELLVTRAAEVLKGTVAKGDFQKDVAAFRGSLLARREEIKEKARIAALRKVKLSLATLARDLERFFSERAYLPDGAALALAFFVLNTWTFSLFDTTPYLCLESATPECGKSTTFRLINAVCCRGRLSTSLTEAVLFRLIDSEHPTLLFDEAEVIEGRSERAECLRAVCHEGYKRGGRVARCEGESKELRWFDVYGPKCFAAIGGLTGALLSRCIPLHLTRAPRDSVRKSTRLRTVERDAKPLRDALEAYAVQAPEKLSELYGAEPDSGYWPGVTDREAELWGPLLLHARLAGPEIEADLLRVCKIISRGKRAIQRDDWTVARTIALHAAIGGLGEAVQWFTPHDLVTALCDSEAWVSTFNKTKDDRGKAAKIGHFLRTFRLESDHTRAGTSYSRKEALKAMAAHVPEPETDSPGSG